MRQVGNVIGLASVYFYIHLRHPYVPSEPRVVVCENYPNCIIPENMTIPSGVILPLGVTFQSNVTASRLNPVPVSLLCEDGNVTALVQNKTNILASLTLDSNSSHDVFQTSDLKSRPLSTSDKLISPWNNAICLVTNFNQLIHKNIITPAVFYPPSMKNSQPKLNKIKLQKEQPKQEGSAKRVRPNHKEVTQDRFIQHQLIQEKPNQDQFQRELPIQRNAHLSNLLLEMLAKLAKPMLKLLEDNKNHIHSTIWMSFYTIALFVLSVWGILQRWVRVVNFRKVMKNVWVVVSIRGKESVGIAMSAACQLHCDEVYTYSGDKMETVKSKASTKEDQTKLYDFNENISVRATKETADPRLSTTMTFDTRKEKPVSKLAYEETAPMINSTMAQSNLAEDSLNVGEKGGLFEVPVDVAMNEYTEMENSLWTAEKVITLGQSMDTMVEGVGLDMKPITIANRSTRAANILVGNAQRVIDKITLTELTLGHAVVDAEQDVAGYNQNETVSKVMTITEAISRKRLGSGAFTCGSPKCPDDIGRLITTKRAGETSQNNPSHRVNLSQNYNDNNQPVTMKSLEPMKIIIDYIRLIQQETSNQASKESSSFLKRLTKEKLFPVREISKALFTKLSNVGSVAIEKPRDLSDAYSIIQAFGPMIEEYYSIMMSVPAVLKEMIQGTRNLLSILREVEVWFGIDEVTQRDRELAVYFCLMVVRYKGNVRLVCDYFSSHVVPENIKALLEVKKTALRSILSQLQSMERTFTILPTEQAETTIVNGIIKLAPLFNDGMRSVERREVMNANKVLISSIASNMIDLIGSIDSSKEKLNELKELGTQIEVNVLAISEHLQANSSLIRVAETFDLENLSKTVAEYLRLLNNSRKSPKVEACYRFFIESAYKARH